MKNKLTLAKYLIYGSAAYRLFWAIWGLISNSISEYAWDYLWNYFSLWQFLWHFPFGYLLTALLIAFSYQRFQKEKPQFNCFYNAG